MVKEQKELFKKTLNFKIVNSKSRLLVAEQATNNSKSIQGSQVLLNKYYLIFACFL